MNEHEKHIEKLKELDFAIHQPEISEAFTDVGIFHETLDYTIEAIKENEELKTVLSAWHNIFGTTQLTHASCRLNVAEKELQALKDRVDVEGVADIIKMSCFSQYPLGKEDNVDKVIEHLNELAKAICKYLRGGR